MEIFSLDINLSRWAIIQYSSNIWKRPTLIQQIANGEYFTNEDRILLSLRKEVDKLTLPCSLKDDLKFAIGSMGAKIAHWTLQLDYIYEIPLSISRQFDILRYLQWNYVGCIDTAKTVETLYRSNLLPIDRNTFHWLCDYCIEYCIEDFWNRVSTNDRYSDVMKDIITFASNHHNEIHLYWLLRMQNDTDITQETTNNVNNSETVDESMLRLAHKHYLETAIYFYNRLSDDQKKAMLTKIIASIDGINWFQGAIENKLHYCMFIIKLYAKNGFENVVIEMLRVFHVLEECLTWPGEYIFWKAVNIDSKFNNPFQWSAIILSLIGFMICERSYIGHDSRARAWFCHVWNSRNNYHFEEEMISTCIRDMCQFRDSQSIKYVVMIEQSSIDRVKLIDIIIGFQELCDVRFFSEIFHQIGREIDDREWFKQILSVRGIDVSNF